MLTHKEFSKRGGAARAKKLTPKRLSEIGFKGAAARWGKQTRARGTSKATAGK